jgi:hypothetical protein
VVDVTSLQQELAEKSQSEAIRTLTATEVGVTRQITSSYTVAARALLL